VIVSTADGPPADRQLPLGNEIFLDHVAHFVADTEAARHALMRAGFAPTPVSVQVNPDSMGGAARATGTGNVTAMLSRGYVEILFKTAETPLAGELEAAMARYRGLHLAAFAVADASAFHRELAERCFRMQPLVHMQRPVESEEGTGEAAFTIARLASGEMPEGRIQALTHHTERLVWQPRWLSHRNGALALLAVVIAIADVEEAVQRYARFTGRNSRPIPFGHAIELDRGRIDLVSSEGFRQMLPDISVPSLPFIGACEMKVASLPSLRALLKGAGINAQERAPHLIAEFPAALGHGAWLFRE
jgi:hypothetical protein